MNRENEPSICFVSPALRMDDVEDYFALMQELEEDFICLPGPSTELCPSESIIDEDEFKLAHRLNHVYRRKLWYPMVTVDFVVSKGFDERGFSAIEAEVAGQVNAQRPPGTPHIRGILFDEKMDFELTKQYSYPLASHHQIRIEAVHSLCEVAPLLGHIASQS